jgi:hypothetical protein
MMTVGEQLSSHLLIADLMLIQELHGYHNSDIWNCPCNNKDQTKTIPLFSYMSAH